MATLQVSKSDKHPEEQDRSKSTVNAAERSCSCNEAGEDDGGHEGHVPSHSTCHGTLAPLETALPLESDSSLRVLV